MLAPLDGVTRPLRQDEAGAVHHVYARGNDRGLIFRDRRDRETYLRLLVATIGRFAWRCLAYCLMGNHVHLVIETPEANLGRGMQRLQGAYARWFNDRHVRSGHVFQGRYGGVRITSDEQLWTAVRYVVLNPVASGACVRPEQYPWSSHSAVLRPDGAVPLDRRRLLWYFGVGGGDPLARYRGLISDETSP